MAQTVLIEAEKDSLAAFTPRQNAVLETALRLLVEGGGGALTTARIARAANCSKESLYKWFGDRDGLLAAIITYQASKVRVPGTGPLPETAAAFREHLEQFASDLLTVLSGDVSLALNRLAIGQASRDDAHLGRLVLERGRRMIGQRAGALLEAGRQRGFIRFDSRDAAFRTLIRAGDPRFPRASAARRHAVAGRSKYQRPGKIRHRPVFHALRNAQGRDALTINGNERV